MTDLIVTFWFSDAPKDKKIATILPTFTKSYGIISHPSEFTETFHAIFAFVLMLVTFDICSVVQV